MADIYAKVGEDKKINVAIIFPAVKVNADQQLFGYPHYKKKRNRFCSAQEINRYRFGTT